MTPFERRLQIVLLGLLAIHAVAALLLPGHLWGASHLAVWPPLVSSSLLLLALVGILMVPRLSRRFTLPMFPRGWRAWILVALAAVAFIVLHERQHLFGDGSLLIRSRGMTLTIFRGPVMVRAIAGAVSAGEDHFGISIETGFRVLSVLAGFFAVILALQLSRVLGHTNNQRWVIFMSLASCGAWQLFFGHVEYYPLLGAVVLGYLLLSVAAVERRLSTWWTWAAFAVLPTLHLSALCLAPAQIFVGIRGWKTERRWIALTGPLVALVLFLLLSRLGEAGGENPFAATAKGVMGYLALYSESEGSRHAFDFLSAAHALAVFNDVLLLAPIALVAIVFGVRKQPRLDPVGLLLVIGAVGCALENVLFNREIGAYRDWDALAPYAFVTLAWAGRHLASEPNQTGTATVWMLATVALLHGLPWTLMNSDFDATERHVRIALAKSSMWSPYARGYMHEEFAILARDHDDLPAAFREYSAAARASPQDPRYRLGAADMALALGEFDTAARSYEEALILRPDFQAAHNNLAYLLLTSGDLGRARFHAKEAIRINPRSSEAHLILGDVEMRSGNIDAAAGAWGRALELRPDSPEARSRLQSLP